MPSNKSESSPMRNRILSSQMKRSISFKLLAQASLLYAALVLCHLTQLAQCEAKEFDWSNLGVSLSSGPKSSLSSGNSNNLRILVSPQRRITKNYEFDYTNNSQPISSQAETSYVIPGSSGPAYLTQQALGHQLGPNHSTHSSAYSALSASLASLKNRLSARGVSLSSPLSIDPNSSTSLYSSGASSSYGSTLLGDSGQQHQQQQQQQQSQPTYLNVGNSAQDSQSSNGGSYVSSQSQSNDNKTIVLAIPAKINFLTDGRSSSGSTKQQQVHPQQQVTVLQPAGDQQANSAYSSKQLGIASGHEQVDQTGQIVGGHEASGNQEHQQYVIVNSPASNGEQLVATNMGGSNQAAYPSFYTAAQQSPMVSSYAMKYIPTYQQEAVQHPAIQKMYSSGGSSEHMTYEPQATAGDQAQMVPLSSLSGAAGMTARYSSCLDTCNSADARWRRYSVSKYKYCCSRSAQYDSQFEHPSSEKLNDASRQADDAYYNYLYRRSRSRRSKRLHRSRHQRYSSATSSPVVANGETSGPVEDEAAGEQAGGEAGSDSGRQATGGRNSYGGQSYDSPSARYYKGRHQYQAQSDGADGFEVPAGESGKYSSAKERSRRGRSRDFDSQLDSHAQKDSSDDESAYEPSSRGTSGYGSGEFSVESGRYPSESMRGLSGDEEEQQRSSYEENGDGEGKQEASDYQGEENAGSSEEADQPEVSYKSYSLASRQPKRKYNIGATSKARSGRKLSSKYHKKSSRAKMAKYGKQEHSSTSQLTNGTDYESAQPGAANEPQSYAGQLDSNSNDEENQSGHQKDSTGGGSDSAGSGEVDKETIALANKYKSSLNDSTVANLSKTTMHLKEILSMLEKKTQLKAANETTNGQQPQLSSSTPSPPITTTGFYPLTLLGSQSLSSSQYNNPTALSDYLTSTDLGLKSPYRYEPSSLTSSLGATGGLSLPSSYGSYASEPYNPLSHTYPASHFGLASPKHLPMSNMHLPKKRRVNKNLRYNSMMLSKHPLTANSPLLQAAVAGKNAFLNPYYSSMSYPYWYPRSNYPSATSSYPYRNIHKSPYQSTFAGPMSHAKLGPANSAGHYSDETRLQAALAGYDQMSSVASSLRPSTNMRLRSKPFVFQPQVLPIYNRHSILTQPLDVKK